LINPKKRPAPSYWLPVLGFKNSKKVVDDSLIAFLLFEVCDRIDCKLMVNRFKF